MNPKKREYKTFINAHAHVFTSRHVPPYLAKTFVPFPFYYLLHLGMIIRIYRFCEAFKALRFKNWHRNLKRVLYKVGIAIRRNMLLRIIRWAVTTWLVVLAFVFIYDGLRLIFDVSNTTVFLVEWIEKLRAALIRYGLLPVGVSGTVKVVLILFVILFIKSGRNLIFFFLKKLFYFFKILPGKHTYQLLQRYLLIAKYAKYRSQSIIFSKMKDQYPPKSGFILLAMDMKYMGAGRKISESYESQLQGLLEIKTSKGYKAQGVETFPFICIDPRRIVEDRQNNVPSQRKLFDYKVEEGQVLLLPCLVKTYIEDHGFNGFKIYPALGYYPFDRELLPLWKYAVQEDIPILAHCIQGTIFYRGKKKSYWDEHPVFMDEDVTQRLLLPELKNIDFQRNFTHPLNYLCLLEEPLLRKLLHHYNDEGLFQLFGFVDPHTKLENDLHTLKVCLAHYGGSEEWKKYLDTDSYAYSQQIIKRPGNGIRFFSKNEDGTAHTNYNRLAKLWKYTDWYSIISSMMMQYPQVYADISYILHNPSIFPLLQETLKSKNGLLPHRVLFGTDFYVVRNHNSEKGLLTTSTADLSETELERIAKENPRNYLSRKT